LKSRVDGAGFTLVEVMVALAVVAVALPALLMSLYQQVDSTAYLRDKSLAHMVAANKLTELRIISRARQSLLRGRDSGITEMADREWYWWLESQPTEVDQFYRLEIVVAAAEEDREQPLHTLVAFLSADLEPDAEPPDAGQ
jgi:general secretion pathway protein I